MAKKRSFKRGDRVCDYQGTRWGTVADAGKVLSHVVWDEDPKRKPRSTHNVYLRFEGEKHPLLKEPYKDPATVVAELVGRTLHAHFHRKS
jgi:hypothetical protein